MTDQGRRGDPDGATGRSPGSSPTGPEGDGPVPAGPLAGPSLANVSADEGTAAPGPGQRDRGPQGDGGGSRGGGSRGGGSRRVRRRGHRRRRILMWVAIGMVLVLILGGSVVYLKLNSNLQSAPLDLGAQQSAEKVDPFGRTALNIMLIGSDTRADQADCKIGGDCSGGANADVEMLVHLAADRSNATVMSIPRDTVANVPQCTSPTHHVYPPQQAVQINSSLQSGGPGCTVAAVHALTGITIDHFIMIDFSGVVNMADDVGGVPVCVSANVYDPYSHLRLTKGSHVVVGLQALEFLRTRHGFLDGGDLYRTQAQHMYLSALIRKMKSASTLANPVTLYRLANDATRAVTVDPGLDSVSKLVSLASDLNEVPAKRITFVTMPTVPYPGNPAAWVAPAEPGAQQLFHDIATDTPLTRAGPAAKPATSTPSAATVTASPAPTVDKASVHISVRNGTGLAGRAHDVAAKLARDGFTAAVGDLNAPLTTTTSLAYGPGERARAQAVAAALGLPASALHRSGTSMTLVIGTDWPSGRTYPGSNPGASPAPSASATRSAPATGSASAAPPPGSAPENASHAGQCAQVNPAYSF
ncbi:MAG TPA: LCP family protein [Streptosporangiaceae bacterium]|nr:LCP family protein [Streptosporangiaceae bacterium]